METRMHKEFEEADLDTIADTVLTAAICCDTVESIGMIMRVIDKENNNNLATALTVETLAPECYAAAQQLAEAATGSSNAWPSFLRESFLATHASATPFRSTAPEKIFEIDMNERGYNNRHTLVHQQLPLANAFLDSFSNYLTLCTVVISDHIRYTEATSALAIIAAIPEPAMKTIYKNLQIPNKLLVAMPPLKTWLKQSLIEEERRFGETMLIKLPIPPGTRH